MLSQSHGGIFAVAALPVTHRYPGLRDCTCWGMHRGARRPIGHPAVRVFPGAATERLPQVAPLVFSTG